MPRQHHPSPWPPLTPRPWWCLKATGVFLVHVHLSNVWAPFEWQAALQLLHSGFFLLFFFLFASSINYCSSSPVHIASLIILAYFNSLKWIMPRHLKSREHSSFLVVLGYRIANVNWHKDFACCEMRRQGHRDRKRWPKPLSQLTNLTAI